MNRPDTPLKFLFPGWFAVVMGLTGLALAWHRAGPVMGETAQGVTLALAVLALAIFLALAVASFWRWRRFPQAWAEDLRHPVRHVFVATIPIGAILLATTGVALLGTHPLARALWWAGSLGQLGITLWVLSRWWREPKAGGLQWATATPALLIPIVGNVLVPLAGVPLGHVEWSIAQFGIGLMFWPVVLVLLVVRLALQGPWPERLRPTVFILIAPPAVIGLSVMQLGAPAALAWALWGMALFCFLWAATQARAIAQLAFGVPHWAMSFPLAALAAFTLRLATPGTAMAQLGTALLALASLVIAGLLLATWRGLRNGSLLAPEPVAAIQPATP